MHNLLSSQPDSSFDFGSSKLCDGESLDAPAMKLQGHQGKALRA